jgi:hypothetical protein
MIRGELELFQERLEPISPSFTPTPFRATSAYGETIMAFKLVLLNPNVNPVLIPDVVFQLKDVVPPVFSATHACSPGWEPTPSD